jgi:two-component system OmpR family sensor kinase
MSIRFRLTIGVLLLLVGVFAAMGVAMARSTESALIEQADQSIKKQSAHMFGPDNNGKGDNNAPPKPESANSVTPVSGTTGDQGKDDDSQYGGGEQTLASFVYRSDGTIRFSSPSGYSDDPDSPPNIPPVGSSEFNRMVNRITTVSSVDGRLDYRVLIEHGRESGDFAVTAAPLDSIRETVRSLIKRFFMIGGLGLILVAFAVWWVIRSEFRPVDSMIDTAAAIAGGDLARRVPEGNPKTELGRLGGALNDMLSQIEEGLHQRDANEQRLRRFVADAAHELRTPLTSVRGYSELYRQGAYPDQASVDHAMSRIESEGSRMARLVDDLLLLARMDQARPLEQRPLDMVSLANEAATDFQTVAPDHPLDWNPSGEVLVRGDPVRLRQIIDNLLSNARTHTPAGTAISMSVQQVGNEAELVIADNGPGMTEEERQKVFERFWRADASRARNTGGSGLGLAIVQSLVTAHGGTVKLKSAPGKGAMFTLRFPVLGTQTTNEAGKARIERTEIGPRSTGTSVGQREAGSPSLTTNN